MSNFSKIVAAIGVVAVVLFVGMLLGWWGNKGPNENIRHPAEEAATTPASENENPGPRPKNPTNTVPGIHPRKTPPGPSATATNLVSDWEDKIDGILGSDLDDAVKARQMLELFPRLPEDGQMEAAQHLSNLVEDKDYEPLGKLLTNTGLPEAVLDVLLADVLNRPNSLKLPLLLKVAEDPRHAKAQEAKDLLELFLEEDYGTDWTKWQAKLETWLKDNPD